MNPKIILIYACLISLCTSQTIVKSFAQSKETGALFTHQYNEEIEMGANYIFDLVEDSTGVLYAINYFETGILQYDGEKWEDIELPRNTYFQLALGPEQIIYVGATNDFGYLKADTLGQKTFISLRTKISTDLLNFGSIRGVQVIGASIYFSSVSHLFCYNSLTEELKIMEVNPATEGLFVIDSVLHLWQQNIGLVKLMSDSFQVVVPTKKKIKIALDLGQGKYIVAENKSINELQGTSLTLYDGAQQLPFAPVAEKLIKQTIFQCGLRLSNGNIALGTKNKGVYIFSIEGQLLHHLTKENGLSGNYVLSLFENNQQQLWVGHYGTGISQIQLGNRVTQFRKDEVGNPLYFLHAARYKDKLLVATNGKEGLYYLDTLSQSLKIFNPKIQSIAIKNILVVGSDLLTIIDDFVMRIDEQAIELIDDFNKGVDRVIHLSLQDSNRVFVGTTKELFSIYKHREKWVFEQFIDAFPKGIEVKTIVESQPGTLWIGTTAAGGWRLDFPTIERNMGGLSTPTVKHFGEEDGFSGSISTRLLGDKIVFQNEFDWIYDSLAQSFTKDTSFQYPIAVAHISWAIYAQKETNQFYCFFKSKLTNEISLGVFRVNSNGLFLWHPIQHPLLSQESLGEVDNLFIEESEVLWLIGERLTRIDLKQEEVVFPFQAQVRQVYIGQDSLVYGGTGNWQHNQLPYIANDLNFRYAANNFPIAGKNKYQSKLEPYDSKWSNWGNKIDRNYTNLREGNYQFLVRAKAPAGAISETGKLVFQILPPWYRTWWSYLAYTLLGILLGSLFYQWIKRRLAQQNAQQLALQEATKIKELDELKNRLYMNITHEFRTPLTVILGMTEQKLNEKGRTLIRRNGKHLLRLVNQLLDLSKLESGNLSLDKKKGNIIAYLEYLTESFHSIAREKAISLIFYPATPEIMMDYDEIKIQHIIYNLISNALKFTQEGGKILLVAQQETEQNGLKLIVKDSGIGMEAAKLPYIFDRFYQVDDSITRKGEGTGIGLALTKELVELMKGSIEVKSELGKGTEFLVWLPIENAVGVPVVTKSQPLANEAKNEVSANNIVPTKVPTADTPLVLIIEDNKEVMEYIRMILLNNYQIEEAENGQAGINKAIELIPDLIISDVMMPEKNGYEVCATLKQDERTNHIPIVLLTAKVTAEARIAAGFEYGADAFLTKPFAKKELLVRLEKLIALRAILQTKYRVADNKNTTEKSVAILNLAFLQKLESFVIKELDNTAFGVTELAKKISLSQTQLYRKIKALTSKTPSQFIRSIRLNKGKNLLENTDLNIAEIAYEVGFTDPNYFSRTFQQEFGVSPRDFRK